VQKCLVSAKMQFSSNAAIGFPQLGLMTSILEGLAANGNLIAFSHCWCHFICRV
jgi:hypothetical protein